MGRRGRAAGWVKEAGPSHRWSAGSLGFMGDVKSFLWCLLPTPLEPDVLKAPHSCLVRFARLWLSVAG